MRYETPRLALGRLRRAAALACVVAAIGVGLEAAIFFSQAEPDPFPHDRSKEFSIAPPAAAVADNSQAAIDTTLAKPLFVQGRGDAPLPVAVSLPPPPPPPPAAPEAEIRLVGVQISENGKLAILQLSDAEGALRAVEGQPVAGWTVARILRDHVELTKESRSRSIYLADTKPPVDEESESQ